MMIKNYFWVALMVMCAITLNMYGQNEDLRQKYNRLATDADAHPADWKKQYDVAQMLIKEGSELFDQEKAGKFYERIYHVASDVNAAVPDSAFYESTYILMLNAINQKNIQKALFYADEITRYGKLKNDPYNSFSISAAALAAPPPLLQEFFHGFLIDVAVAIYVVEGYVATYRIDEEAVVEVTQRNFRRLDDAVMQGGCEAV